MNIAAKLIEQIKLRPNDTAIQIVSKSSFRKISFYDLGRQINHYTSFLSQCGLKKNDRILLQVNDPLVDITSFVALSSLGVGIFVAPQFLTKKEQDVIELLDIKKRVILNSQDTNTPHTISLAPYDLKKRPETLQSNDPDLPETDNSPWMIRTSSGTTGIPKTFIPTHCDGDFRRQRYYDAVKIEAGDSFCSFTPPKFGAARQRIFYALSIGAQISILENNLSMNKIIEHINANKITHIYSVPMHLERLCDYAVQRNIENKSSILFPNIKNLETTSSIVSTSLRRKVENLLTPQFSIAYSISEVGHISSTGKSTFPDSDLTSLGKPVKGVRVSIVDSLLKEKSSGQTGSIAIKFENRMTRVEYLDTSGKWINLIKNGWFITGDSGSISKNGNLIFQGRCDDMMIYDGVNIYPQEIETIAIEHPEVTDVVAFPLNSRVHNQIPCIAVILKTSVLAKDLNNYFRSKSGNCSPAYILVLRSFPRNAMGKIVRSELQKMLLQSMKTNQTKEKKPV